MDLGADADGKALGHYKMAKHFHYRIRSNGFTYERNQASIEREAALDGIYVIRTSANSIGIQRTSGPPL